MPWEHGAFGGAGVPTEWESSVCVSGRRGSCCSAVRLAWLEMEHGSRLGQTADGTHTLLKFLDRSRSCWPIWWLSLWASMSHFQLRTVADPHHPYPVCYSPSIAVPLPTHNPAYPSHSAQSSLNLSGENLPLHTHTQDWIQHPLCVSCLVVSDSLWLHGL